jgi:hypothetical protein
MPKKARTPKATSKNQSSRTPVGSIVATDRGLELEFAAPGLFRMGSLIPSRPTASLIATRPDNPSATVGFVRGLVGHLGIVDHPEFQAWVHELAAGNGRE